MAKSFLRKKPMQQLPAKLTGGVVRGIGAAGSAYVSNTLLRGVLRKWHGPIFFGVGLAAEALIENEMVNNVGQGMQAYGAIDSARLLLPGSVDQFGLNSDGGSADPGIAGIAATPVEVAQFNADLAQALQEANAIPAPGAEPFASPAYQEEEVLWS